MSNTNVRALKARKPFMQTNRFERLPSYRALQAKELTAATIRANRLIGPHQSARQESLPKEVREFNVGDQGKVKKAAELSAEPISKAANQAPAPAEKASPYPVLRYRDASIKQNSQIES